jgi:hypothetical protein
MLSADTDRPLLWLQYFEVVEIRKHGLEGVGGGSSPERGTSRVQVGRWAQSECR